MINCELEAGKKLGGLRDSEKGDKSADLGSTTEKQCPQKSKFHKVKRMFREEGADVGILQITDCPGESKSVSGEGRLGEGRKHSQKVRLKRIEGE